MAYAHLRDRRLQALSDNATLKVQQKGLQQRPRAPGHAPGAISRLQLRRGREDPQGEEIGEGQAVCRLRRRTGSPSQHVRDREAEPHDQVIRCEDQAQDRYIRTFQGCRAGQSGSFQRLLQSVPATFVPELEEAGKQREARRCDPGYEARNHRSCLDHRGVDVFFS